MTKSSPGQPSARPVPAGRARRTVPLAGLAARTAVEEVLALLLRRVGRDDLRSAAHHARGAERYVKVMGRSKGVLMKVGQMLSFVSLTAAVPEEQRSVYQAALGRLQADVPPMAPELARAALEAELGRPPEDIFSEFSALPLAAASIGQVHAARLRDGRAVAVKIQYPGVEEAIRSDLRNAELVATFFSFLAAAVPGMIRVDLRALAAEVSERIGDELDYRQEAVNQTAFADAYRHHPFIHVPRVLPELSTRRVLTQDLVDGLRWSEALLADQPLRDRWGEVIYRFALGSVTRLGMFNADPHPGNYLFHPDGTVSFVDFGCVKHFEPDQVKAIAEVTGAVLHDDPQRLWRTLVEVNAIDATTGPSPEALFEWRARSAPLLTGIQPLTVTRDVTAAALRREFSPAGPSAAVVRAFSTPVDWIFLTRIDSGIAAILAELHATGDWRAIQLEIDEGAAPATSFGVIDRKFWKERGRNVP